MPFTFTLDELAALRDSLQSRSPDGTGALAVPFLVWSPAGVWCLHANGRAMAEGTDPALLCRALANEREHPSWLAGVCGLDPEPPAAYEPAGATPHSTPPARVADLSLDDLF